MRLIRHTNSLIVRCLLKIVKTKDNFLLFESGAHHIFDNSYYLYKYLIGYKKLHLYYIVYNKEQFLEAKEKGVKKSHILFLSNRITIHKPSNLLYIIKWRIILKKSKVSFISYRNFFKEYNIPFYEKQIIVNLRHGQFPIKNVFLYYKGLCFSNNDNVYFRVGTQESLYLLPPAYKTLNCKWFVSTMPRLDSFFEDKTEQVYNMLNINKEAIDHPTIFLLMTTLHFKEGSYFDSQFPFKTNVDDFKKINKYLGEHNSILVIKSHHDVSFKESDYQYRFKNIIFISDNDLVVHNLFINHLLAIVDALLTDYSSVFFDFLYCNKPIGFLISNKERQYVNKNSLNAKDYGCGQKIENINQMISFFKYTLAGTDLYQKRRDEIFKLFNGEKHNNYSQDITDMFINKKYLSN